MANAAETPIEGEYRKPDAKLAISIHRKEIAPWVIKAAEARGECAEPWKRIKDQANFPKKILTLLVDLNDMEEDKRDHHLIALHAGLAELRLHMPSDLVTMAQGEAGGDIVPIGERKRPQLATIPASDGKDDDLVEAAGEDDDANENDPFGWKEDDEEADAGDEAEGHSEPDARDDDAKADEAEAEAEEADDGADDANDLTATEEWDYDQPVDPKNVTLNATWRDSKTGKVYIWSGQGAGWTLHRSETGDLVQ